MTYTALYRKFRPLKFNEIVGQEHITNTLKKQIIAGRVGHAYIFTGGRGTGKTTSAKILARAVNCLNLQNGEPCNECEICKGILDGSLTDVVEMDAASNNSVEDIRAIREEVNFLPTKAKYRVYIIDETHMLSTGAFNALLKTLEEPPEHVKFILATTEPQKLPATILSRCQRFDFKRIQNEDIVKRLKIICGESNIKITESALRIIAVLSEGAMRDAISILERCTGENKNTIDENDVRELVGIPKLTQIYEIVKAILEYNITDVLKVTNEIIKQGKDIDNFLWEIIKYLKDILVFKATNELELYNEQEQKQIKELSDIINKERLIKLIYKLSEIGNEIKWTSQKSIVFQVNMINACSKEEIVKNREETKTVIDIPEAQKVNRDVLENNSTIKKDTVKHNLGNEMSIQKQNNTGNKYWDNVINKIKEQGKMAIYVNLIGSSASQVNDLVVEVELSNKSDFAKKMLEMHENKTAIEKIVSEELGKPMSIKFITTSSKVTNNGNKNSIENIAKNSDIPFNIIDE